MAKERRNGIRKLRDSNRRKPELGYYLIVTDTTGTERVYFNGLRASIKDAFKEKLIIRVRETKNRNMIQTAKDFLLESPQYAEPWIVFDKDKNEKFDEIIEKAQCSGINVAWSNPCIEVWLYSYFGKIPYYQDSVMYCKKFSNEYKKNVGQEYDKADNLLYHKLTKFGNEEDALKIAERKVNEHSNNNNVIPSQMIPATMVFELVKEIKSKL